MTPIVYQADYLFELVESKQFHKDFLRALSKTTNMSLFQTGFIQRYIEYRWHGTFKWYLYFSLTSHLITIFLLVINLNMLEYENDTREASARFIINMLNGVVVLLSTAFFEVRQLKQEGWNYFKDTWN